MRSSRPRLAVRVRRRLPARAAMRTGVAAMVGLSVLLLACGGGVVPVIPAPADPAVDESGSDTTAEDEAAGDSPSGGDQSEDVGVDAAAEAEVDAAGEGEVAAAGEGEVAAAGEGEVAAASEGEVAAAGEGPAAEPVALVERLAYVGALSELFPRAAAVAAERLGAVSVAVIDFGSGRAYRVNGERLYPLASVAKVPLMLTLLTKIQAEEEPLSDDDAFRLRAMITQSDNFAADALWQRAGGRAAETSLLASLGLWPDLMAVGRQWGAVEAGALATALLVGEIAVGTVLPEAVREQALELMRSVIPEQAWGVSAGLEQRASVAVVGLKNGWFEDEDGWRVHSAGIVSNVAFGGEEAPRYALVVLTARQPSFGYGRETIELIAREVHQAIADIEGAAALLPR